MIELTEQQLQALEHPDSTPPRVVNPWTRETFVLIREDEYERLKEEYDESPCCATRCRRGCNPVPRSRRWTCPPPTIHWPPMPACSRTIPSSTPGKK